MSELRLQAINKIYGDGANAAHIIKDADLHIQEGEFVVFVGPSGCGKSTMLRMIAGLESISSGELWFDQDVVNDLSPAQRGVGMVFQSYALYPHMSVRENIAFGVKYTRNWNRQQTAEAVNEIAEALELTALLEHKPAQMSGGQRQRVAIGRALVRQPRVFLLDEPLSNLDAALRVRMRMQIAEFHRRFKSTTVYVTHDQVEAMTLADKVVVLNGGRIEQVGSPLELYQHPQTEFVAKFIGSPKMNTFNVQRHASGVQLDGELLPVKVAPECQAKELTLGVRPEDVVLDSKGPILARVHNVERLGAESLIYAQLTTSGSDLTIRCNGISRVQAGEQIRLNLPEYCCHLFDKNGRALMAKG